MLIVWPKNRDSKLLVKSEEDRILANYAIAGLQASASTCPDKRESKLFKSLVKCGRRQKNFELDLKQRTMSILFEVTKRWNDVGLFLTAAQAYGVNIEMDVFGVEGFISAYKAFSWVELESLFVSPHCWHHPLS